MRVIGYLFLVLMVGVALFARFPPKGTFEESFNTRPDHCPHRFAEGLVDPDVFVFRGRFVSEIKPRELTKVEKFYYEYYGEEPTSHYIFSVDYKYNDVYKNDRILLSDAVASMNDKDEYLVFVKMDKPSWLSETKDFEEVGTCRSSINLSQLQTTPGYAADAAKRIVKLEKIISKGKDDHQNVSLSGVDYYRDRFSNTFSMWFYLTWEKAKLLEGYGRYDDAQKAYEEAMVYVANKWLFETDGTLEKGSYSLDAPLEKMKLGETCSTIGMEVEAPAFIQGIPSPQEIKSLKAYKSRTHRPWDLYYAARIMMLDYGRLLYRKGLYERALLPLCSLPDTWAHRKHHKAREWRILALLKLGLKDKIPMDVFDMSGIKINKLDLSDIALRNTNFSGADIGELIVKNTKIPSSSFQEARIGNLIVYETDLSQSNFNHAVVTNGWMKKSDISGTSFVCANLTLSDLSESKTDDAIWENTYRSFERYTNNSSVLENDTADYQKVCADLLREQKRQERIKKNKASRDERRRIDRQIRIYTK